MPASARAPAPRNSEIVAAADLPGFHAQLLGWFAEAKRDLDWRATRDPYRVWISEIMLQQTRVAAVVPYYRRFLERFPTVNDLAGARIDAVLRHWAGLGYYSRARNLHRAAKEIVARHRGEFPRLLEDALALPGIGRYTAAAVLSIAYRRAARRPRRQCRARPGAPGRDSRRFAPAAPLALAQRGSGRAAPGAATNNA